MNLWIQIPCFNEQDTIGRVINGLPNSLPGISSISILVIDDGSTDETCELVRQLTASNANVHLLSLGVNRGLANAFASGMRFCLARGADAIVNTDGDGQYSGFDVEALVSPILQNRADVVIGDRNVSRVAEFSIPKKWLQFLGSKVVSLLCGTEISDATSGFRIYNRNAASRMFLTSKFTYTLESLVQLSTQNMIIVSVPVSRNNSTRPSRLFTSNFQYIKKNGWILARSFIRYRPLKTFLALASLFFASAIASWIPFFINHFSGNPSGHIQSTVLGVGFALTGVLMIALGLIGDGMLQNKLLLHQILKDKYF